MRNFIISALHRIGQLVGLLNLGGEGGRGGGIIRGGDEKRMQNIGPEPEEERLLRIARRRRD
jgi:hypothetical protein